jgi:hypothetical protein
MSLHRTKSNLDNCHFSSFLMSAWSLFVVTHECVREEWSDDVCSSASEKKLITFNSSRFDLSTLLRTRRERSSQRISIAFFVIIVLSINLDKTNVIQVCLLLSVFAHLVRQIWLLFVSFIDHHVFVQHSRTRNVSKTSNDHQCAALSLRRKSVD